NNSSGFSSKSSSVGFHKTSMPYACASGVSSNSICMSMMCVIPALATFAMLSDVQIPPPTAIRSVNHVMSIPVLCGAELLARLRASTPTNRLWVPHVSRVFRDVGILTSDFGPTQIATGSRRTALLLILRHCWVLDFLVIRGKHSEVTVPILDCTFIARLAPDAFVRVRLASNSRQPRILIPPVALSFSGS